MDTSNPAVFVNGELLPSHLGKKVRAVVQVMHIEGGNVIGKTTDERQIIIKGPLPPHHTAFVEVIGIADTRQSIHPEIFTNFGDTFDSFTYNRVCQLAHGEHKNLFL